MAIDTIGLIVLAIWLIALSVVVYINFRFFRRLEKDTGQINLKKITEKIIANGQKDRLDIEELFRRAKSLEEEGRLHIQKVGLVRFNPFREMGGDHSFSLALLDGKDTGVIVTGLHTRERTRVYMKAIKNGKSELELSEDEKKALVKAQRG